MSIGVAKRDQGDIEGALFARLGQITKAMHCYAEARSILEARSALKTRDGAKLEQLLEAKFDFPRHAYPVDGEPVRSCFRPLTTRRARWFNREYLGRICCLRGAGRRKRREKDLSKRRRAERDG